MAAGADGLRRPAGRIGEARMHTHQGDLSSYLGVGGIVLIVMALRMRRMMQSRPYRLESSWILPVLFILLTGVALSAHLPQGLEWAWIVGGLAIGAALGWLRAMTIRLTVDPATHLVMAQGSPLAIVFLLLVLMVRFGLRSYLETESNLLGISVVVVDSAFLAMACGLFVARAIEMGLRSRKLLSQTPAIIPG
jgi:amino acid transporter